MPRRLRIGFDVTPPGAPGTPSVSAVSSSALTVSWTAATDTGGAGVASYRVERATAVGGPYTQVGIVAAGPVLAYADSGLAASTTYFYRVRAVDASNNLGAFSLVGSATTQASAGGTVTAASASQADVAAAIAAAPVGGTVNVPAGSGTWNTLQISKGVSIVGAGIGVTNITLGTGNGITKQAAAITRLRGFTFNRSTGGNNVYGFIIDGPWTTAEPVIIEECRFNVSASGLFNPQIAGGLIIAKCSFYGLWDDSFLKLKKPVDSESWFANDTMGNRDTNGKLNIYFEDCYYYGGTNQGIDADDAARVVCRGCRFDYGSFNSHGLDTSAVGVRHFEVYNNEFRNPGWTGSTAMTDISNQNWAIWIRGGTGVIYNNAIDNIANSQWGTGKEEAKFDIRAQQDNSGASYGHFTDGRAKYSAGQGTYPRQRQLGQNWSNTLTNSVGLNGGVGDYFTDPIYVWGNTGAGTSGGSFLSWANGGSWGSQTGYFVAGRDYVFGNTAKPGYTAYTYPHPLRVTTGKAY